VTAVVRHVEDIWRRFELYECFLWFANVIRTLIIRVYSASQSDVVTSLSAVVHVSLWSRAGSQDGLRLDHLATAPRRSSTAQMTQTNSETISTPQIIPNTTKNLSSLNIELFARRPVMPPPACRKYSAAVSLTMISKSTTVILAGSP